jgi:Spy/CpxP family protein refolding chaperone
MLASRGATVLLRQAQSFKTVQLLIFRKDRFMRVLSFKTVAATFAAIVVAQAGAALADTGLTTVGFGGGHGHGILTDQLHQTLNLTPDEETLWQQLKQQQLALRTTAKTARQQLRAVRQAEMAKTQPDLAAIDSAIDTAHETIYAAQKAFRQQVLAFYTALTPERQAIFISALKAKAEKAKAWRKSHSHVKPNA